MKLSLPWVKGANHTCISDYVKYTPSINLSGVRGSPPYSFRTLISEGSAFIYRFGWETSIGAPRSSHNSMPFSPT